MNPVGLALLVLGSLGTLLSIVYFIVIAEKLSILPLIIAVSLCSAIEAVGLLIIVRSRQA